MNATAWSNCDPENAVYPDHLPGFDIDGLDPISMALLTLGFSDLPGRSKKQLIIDRDMGTLPMDFEND